MKFGKIRLIDRVSETIKELDDKFEDVVEDNDDDKFEFAEPKITNSKVDKVEKNTKSKLAKVDLEDEVDWDEIDKPKKKKVVIDDDDFVF